MQTTRRQGRRKHCSRPRTILVGHCGASRPTLVSILADLDAVDPSLGHERHDAVDAGSWGAIILREGIRSGAVDGLHRRTLCNDVAAWRWRGWARIASRHCFRKLHVLAVELSRIEVLANDCCTLAQSWPDALENCRVPRLLTSLGNGADGPMSAARFAG